MERENRPSGMNELNVYPAVMFDRYRRTVRYWRSRKYKRADNYGAFLDELSDREPELLGWVVLNDAFCYRYFTGA